jgi:monoamine oxidase
MDAAVRTIFGAEAADLSALFFLAYLNAGGGFLALAGTRGGAQEERLVGGVQSLAQRLTDGLDVRLEAPVLSVRHEGAHVTLQTRELTSMRSISASRPSVTLQTRELTIRARRAVFAIPPTQLHAIAFDPLLSAPRRHLTARAFMGSTTKILALYDRPFWREAGLSGEVVSGEGPLSVVFDNTSRDGRQPALVGFVVGRHARELTALPESARRTRVVSALERAFGPAARRPSELVFQDWSREPYVGGCPVAVFGPGALTSSASHLRAPEGRLHFAGTETAREHTGYLEGALESAERASDEILRLGL